MQAQKSKRVFLPVGDRAPMHNEVPLERLSAPEDYRIKQH